VIADVHAGAQPNDHCQASIFKMPPNEFFNANVQHGAGDNARDERLFMSSGDIMSGRSANLNRLHHKLYFENNSADISASSRLPGSTTHDGRAFLQEIKTSFDAASATGGVQIQLVGHASSVGTTMHNQGLSEQRAANVEAELRSLGLVGHINRTIDRGEGETGAANVAEWRRVDIIVGSGEQQNTAAHEFGHMLGLGDEYFLSPGGVFRGNSAPLGSAATHNNVNNRVGDTEIDGAVVENNDGIMSLGNTVRPQHYATFHFALEHVTGKRWRYGGEGNAPSVIPGTVVPGGGVIT
jgi:outer membrane protein OmpA-like peptidoglycan-associated protein